VANDAAAIDNAMKWGYNWSVGPFELWDIIGVEKSVERMQAEGETIPVLVTDLLAAGKTCFYDKDSGGESGKRITAVQLRKQSKPILANADASLLDLGDGVACFVLHSPNSSITDNAIALMNQAVGEVEANYRGMVIAGSGKNFCVGANLQLVLGLAQAKNWTGLEKLVSDFQTMNMNLKYCAKPVVAAPYAMTLGAGAEMAMHARQVCVYGETYLGLVEIGVGLLPGGGGTKELLLRMTGPAQADATIDLTPFVSKAFAIISSGKVSASGPDAIRIGYLQPDDILVMNKDSQLHQAKLAVLQQAQFLDPQCRDRQYRVGGHGLLALYQYGLYNKQQGGFISPYDQYVAGKIAHVLCGGNVADNTLVTEQYLLDLEKELFVSLCGEAKTQERMLHMLKTGKPLRN
jgi:3-hydroxyacyl-CoA dehydrogenase